MMRAACLALALTASCGTGGECKRYPLYNAFHYTVKPSVRSPSGIDVDPTGQSVDMDKIERQTDEVEACLRDAFGDPPRIPDDVMRDAQCVARTFTLPLARECLTVKVPDDWLLSCDGSQQLLPALAPEQGCREKGLEPTPECPCRWRAGVQDDHIIVVTPSFYLYKDALIRVSTGCNDPWRHPALAECAKPTVTPLP